MVWRISGFLIIIIYNLFISMGYANNMSAWDDTYNNLDIVVNNKTNQLFSYLEALKENAEKVTDDSLMTNFFQLEYKYYQLKQGNKTTPRLIELMGKLDETIKQHFIYNYLNFYDILFINNDGDIFYTIKKQPDYLNNVFTSEFESLSISEKIRSSTDRSFVDYQYYPISNEPSAFFIQPLYEKGNKIGWIAFQCSINNINRLFSRNNLLGVTGEVVLVNRDHYLLTDSRFMPETSILKQQLPEQNIESKFRQGSGHKSVIDYRGHRALSSFKVCQVFDCEWLIIAKIDESEVITNYYIQNSNRLYNKMMELVKYADCSGNFSFDQTRKRVEVDMDEYQRTINNEILYTHGVSTCTALLITYPGKFSYLAHISPYDRLYGQDTTDLLDNILRNIHKFEIYPSEKQNIRFLLIAPHDQVAKSCIEYLITEGYFLSQIKILCNEKAKNANVYFDHNTSKAIVEWEFNDGINLTYWDSSNLSFLEEHVKDILFTSVIHKY